jgi:hypothetical protein
MKFRTPAAAACAVGLAYLALYLAPRPEPPGAAAPAELLSPDPAAAQAIARSAAKEAIAREVIAGRMTLPEAADRFGRLNAMPPPAPVRVPNLLAADAGLADSGGYTGAELPALQVVAWVAIVAREDCPDRAEEVAARARDQFRADRAAGRLARPPEVPAE